MTWRRGPRDEAGQSSGEYVGVVAFVATVAVALFSVTGVAAASGLGVAKTALCTIGTPLGLGPCDDVDADDVLTSMTPEELATVGDYVALGDSYSSGEGADDYLEGTNSDDATKESLNDLNGWLWPGDPHNNICRRSEHAYSAEVYGAFDFQGDYVFAACSGGVIEDYYEDNTSGNEGEGPQRDHITDDTSLVTISMGGNDFGFGPVVASCISGNCATEDKAGEVDGDIDAQIDRLAQLYRDLASDAPPGARILVVGYPQMFPDEGEITNGGDSFISEAEQQWLNERGVHANWAIQEAIRRSGTTVEYVDVSDALEGHEIGTDDPWINDLDMGVDGGDWFPPASRNSFHPNADGHAAIAAIVRQHVRKGP
jgi:lysophospholipase L1-like esterase